MTARPWIAVCLLMAGVAAAPAQTEQVPGLSDPLARYSLDEILLLRDVETLAADRESARMWAGYASRSLARAREREDLAERQIDIKRAELKGLELRAKEARRQKDGPRAAALKAEVEAHKGQIERLETIRDFSRRQARYAEALNDLAAATEKAAGAQERVASWWAERTAKGVPPEEPLDQAGWDAHARLQEAFEQRERAVSSLADRMKDLDRHRAAILRDWKPPVS
ncbi:MAG TPA: hypothetical protein VJV23_06280 [Candidatus Polarisedimenticolia bacterium]|nr:hypothetical protein [Candidatus Polarisedimenticolia bacterium]